MTTPHLSIDTEAATNTAARTSALPPTRLSLLEEYDDEDADLERNTYFNSLVTPTNNNGGVPGPPPTLKSPLSEVSKQFDRHGKGYLDETERALRRMDSQNLGYLTVHKVYNIMETLQSEQKNSAKLLTALERQQREALNLKKGIFGLCVFAVLLALSNIGTSFAAAKLAKEVTVSSSTGDLEDVSTVSLLYM